MDQYDVELQDALGRLLAQGRDQTEFSFQRTFLAPEPDGAGMFTVQYEVRISRQTTAKSLVVIGGIGLRWVDHFEGALNNGRFD